MKRLIFLTIIFMFIISTSTVFAAEEAPLGIGNIAVKLDYIDFTDSGLEDADVDSGFYIGIEGYGQIVPNLYLGLEVGYTNPDGNVDSLNTELTYVPIELNLKYAVEATPEFVIDFGAGISYNYADLEFDSYDEDDWVFGGQFFADMNYKIEQFFIGINGKYQITQDFEDADFNCNNWRIGGNIGIMF